MKTAKQYRNRAAFMRRLAEDFPLEDLRAAYSRLADDFDEVARRLEAAVSDPTSEDDQTDSICQ